MSVHISFNRICDRCEKPFDLRSIRYEDGLPAVDPKLLTLTDGGKQVFSYADLCLTCEGVVRKLVKRLMLDEEKEKKGTDAGPKSEGATEQSHKELTEPVAAPVSGSGHPF